MAPSHEESSPIPIIDFGPFIDGEAVAKQHVAQQLDDAFRTVGFVYLRNHGVSQALVDECFEWSKKFFALPMSEKMLAPHPPGGSHHRGYSAPGVEKVSQHAYSSGEIAKLREIPDCKESFESGNPTDTAQPNIWPPPATLPGFQPFLESYFAHCAALVHTILNALDQARNLDAASQLEPTHSTSSFQLRLLHYPAIPASELQNNARSRINAHSDFGTLTLLWQDSVGGLEVADPHATEKWRAAPPVDGAVLVNVGDLLARWSNERWRSTVHRVGLPRGWGLEGGGEGEDEVVPDRYSIPFFATADVDAVVEALPGCWDEGGERPKKYRAVTAGEYVQMRMAALYE